MVGLSLQVASIREQVLVLLPLRTSRTAVNSNEIPGFKGKLTLCMYFSFIQQTIKTTPLPTRHCRKHWRCKNELDITPVLRILLDVFATDCNTKGFIYICCEMLYRFFVYFSQVVFVFDSSHLSITEPHS